jgi:hypothetical protein
MSLEPGFILCFSCRHCEGRTFEVTGHRRPKGNCKRSLQVVRLTDGLALIMFELHFGSKQSRLNCTEGDCFKTFRCLDFILKKRNEEGLGLSLLKPSYGCEEVEPFVVCECASGYALLAGRKNAIPQVRVDLLVFNCLGVVSQHVMRCDASLELNYNTCIQPGRCFNAA